MKQNLRAELIFGWVFIIAYFGILVSIWFTSWSLAAKLALTSLGILVLAIIIKIGFSLNEKEEQDGKEQK